MYVAHSHSSQEITRRLRAPNDSRTRLRRQNEGKINKTFIEILAFARHLEATDLRDHVFAFLGHPAALQFPLGHEATADMDYGSVISLGPKPLIQPDYTKSLGEIYTEFAVKTFEATNNLDLLSCIIHFENSIEESIPSWVPRWDLPGVSQVSFGTTIKANIKRFQRVIPYIIYFHKE